MSESGRSIAGLEEQVLALPAAERDRVARIYHIVTTVGRLCPPASMLPWIEKQFGSPSAVEAQHIVKVTNLITLEGALFNALRAQRPMEARAEPGVEAEIAQTGDPFCRPEEGTPADVFGRVRGKHCLTASNVAKYDGFHGLVIFDEHNPLAFTADGVADYVETALTWARKAHSADNAARYFFFMWNCLWRAGASIIHGHAQMTLSRGLHYARVEALRRAALLYRVAHGDSYFDDLVTVHRSLGLATTCGTWPTVPPTSGPWSSMPPASSPATPSASSRRSKGERRGGVRGCSPRRCEGTKAPGMNWDAAVHGCARALRSEGLVVRMAMRRATR